jgi:hypothetical protein
VNPCGRLHARRHLVGRRRRRIEPDDRNVAIPIARNAATAVDERDAGPTPCPTYNRGVHDAVFYGVTAGLIPALLALLITETGFLRDRSVSELRDLHTRVKLNTYVTVFAVLFAGEGCALAGLAGAPRSGLNFTIIASLLLGAYALLVLPAIRLYVNETAAIGGSRAAPSGAIAPALTIGYLVAQATAFLVIVVSAVLLA